VLATRAHRSSLPAIPHLYQRWKGNFLDSGLDSHRTFSRYEYLEQGFLIERFGTVDEG
jgi:hypothetical protein